MRRGPKSRVLIYASRPCDAASGRVKAVVCERSQTGRAPIYPYDGTDPAGPIFTSIGKHQSAPQE